MTASAITTAPSDALRPTPNIPVVRAASVSATCRLFGALGLIAALLVACAHTTGRSSIPTASRAAPRFHVDYPDMICREDAGPTAGTVRQRLAAARQATVRGCPREALADLANLHAAGGSPSEEAEGLLVAMEAWQDAVTAGFTRDAAPTYFATRPWMEAPGQPAEMIDGVRLLTRAFVDQQLPETPEFHIRFVRLIARRLGQTHCGGSAGSSHSERDEAPLQRLLLHLLPPLRGTGRGLREMARLKVGTCHAADADALAEQAEEAFLREGQPVEAAEAALFAAGTQIFDHGRVSDLELDFAGPPNPFERINVRAAGEIASEQGAGALFARGQAARVRLDALAARLSAGAMDDANRATLGWMRALVELRLRRDPAAAQRFAEAALRDAAQAERADLVDAAGAVLFLAAIDRSEWDRAGAYADALARSLERRGAVGAANALGKSLTLLSALYTAEGRVDQGIHMMRAARVIEPLLTPLIAAEFMGESNASPLTTGRLEEADESIAWSLRRWDARRAELPQAMWQAQRDRIMLRQETSASLSGRSAEAPADLDPPTRVLQRAILRGDERALLNGYRAVLQRGGDEMMAPITMLAATGYCTLIRPLLVPLADDYLTAWRRLERADRQRPEDAAVLAAKTELGVAFVVLPGRLMHCGAVLNDPALVQRARMIAETQTGASAGFSETMLQAGEAAARGHYAHAADLFLAAARQYTDMSRGGSSASVGTSQMYDIPVANAVASLLKAPQPDLARVVVLLEDSHARSLRIDRLTHASALRDSSLGGLSEVEQAIATVQGRARALAQLAAGADDAATREALARAQREAQSGVDELTTRREGIVRELRSRNTHAYEAAALEPVTAASIAARLLPDETLVYYHLDTDEGWAIVCDREQIRSIPLASIDPHGIPQLLLAVNRHRWALERRLNQGRGLSVVHGDDDPTDGDPARALSEARARLYELLVRPLEAFIPPGRRVVIVPDGLTAALPFAALGPEEQPWVTRNPLRVLPGAYMLPATRSTARLDGAALVLGDPEFGGERRQGALRGGASSTNAASVAWERLPATREEAQAIGAIWNTAPLLGRNATEAALRQGASQAGLLHLATHGLADANRPDWSALVLAMPDEGSSDDGILHAFEIEGIQLRASLVVLSACETGVGQMRGGEGVLALDRAFLLAGAEAVISSLWVVNDRSTEVLMRHFYEALRSGRPADVALTEAMRATRTQDPRWRDPFFWGAFRVIGAGLR